MDENTKFLQKYLSKEERDLFFDCFVLPPDERKKTALRLSKEILWIGCDLARNGDIELKEHYINYVSALGSFLRGKHPQKGWITLRIPLD